jgi:phospholipid-transporting ATPase
MVLVIDGKSLTFALEDDIKDTFLELAMLCKAVVCCRVSPLQKALVVKLVKKNVAGAVTLAVGDGANDVSMIQAAHVGVGISGQEGLQAARASDFSIGQFRYLKKLLLVHGGWGYSRVTKVIVICFYKNITLYLIQFWFTLNNGFSGMTLFETWSSVASYNVVWTLLPPIAIGMFDQYVSARTLDRYPQLYRLGQTDTFYNHKIFLGWILNSFFHSLLLFYLWTWCLGSGDILLNGLVADNWAFGTMVYITTILTVLIKHCLIIDSFVVHTSYAVVGSFLVFMIFFPLVFYV